jgi:hypothetical protein
MTVLSMAALTACAAEDAPPAVRLAPHASFTENGVAVDLTVTDWEAPDGTLKVTFTPTEEGFHLYSTELPARGVEGVGRPTTVTVTGAVEATRKATASAAVHNIKVLGVHSTVPVYPDGPVTLSVPVHTEAPGDAAALLSYASCSISKGCSIPVVNHSVTMHITDDAVAFG